MLVCPCKGCEPPKRNKTCHVVCEEYLEYDKLRKEEKERLDAIRKQWKQVDDHKIASYVKAKRKREKKGR